MLNKIGLIIFLIMFSSFSQAIEMEDCELAKLGALNKITGKNSILEVNVGEKTTFGDLRIEVKSCQKSSPLDAPESAAYLNIKDSKEQLFSGWMFASSPALSAMESGVYDIWVVECEKKLEK